MADDTPPTNFVAYPRGERYSQIELANYGSVERLEALVDGYFSLSQAFQLSFLVFLVGLVGVAMDTPIAFLACLAVPVCIYLAALRPARLIAKGKGWPEATAWLISLCILASGLVFGFIVVQHVALSEMRRYGLKYSLLGVKNKDIVALLAKAKSTRIVTSIPIETP